MRINAWSLPSLQQRVVKPSGRAAGHASPLLLAITGPSRDVWPDAAAKLGAADAARVHSDCRRKIGSRRRWVGAVSGKSVRLDNLTLASARCEGVGGMARSIREQGRTLPREVHS
jgi:hypothetical protein